MAVSFVESPWSMWWIDKSGKYRDGRRVSSVEGVYSDARHPEVSCLCLALPLNAILMLHHSHSVSPRKDRTLSQSWCLFFIKKLTVHFWRQVSQWSLDLHNTRHLQYAQADSTYFVRTRLRLLAILWSADRGLNVRYTRPILQSVSTHNLISVGTIGKLRKRVMPVRTASISGVTSGCAV